MQMLTVGERRVNSGSGLLNGVFICRTLSGEIQSICARLVSSTQLPKSRLIASLANPTCLDFSRFTDRARFLLSAAHSAYVRKLGTWLLLTVPAGASTGGASAVVTISSVGKGVLEPICCATLVAQEVVAQEQEMRRPQTLQGAIPSPLSNDR
jgi:hypothetical protein